MAQTNLSMKQKQNEEQREQTDGCKEEVKWGRVGVRVLD